MRLIVAASGAAAIKGFAISEVICDTKQASAAVVLVNSRAALVVQDGLHHFGFSSSSSSNFCCFCPILGHIWSYLYWCCSCCLWCWHCCYESLLSSSIKGVASHCIWTSAASWSNQQQTQKIISAEQVVMVWHQEWMPTIAIDHIDFPASHRNWRYHNHLYLILLIWSIQNEDPRQILDPGYFPTNHPGHWRRSLIPFQQSDRSQIRIHYLQLI